MTAPCSPAPTDAGLQLLNPEIISGIFTPQMAYDSQLEAFTELAHGNAWQPDKIGGGHPGDDSTVFCYASRLNRTTGPISKFGSVNPANPAHGLPSIHAVVVLLHPETGVPVAILDGTAITVRRTAAASAVAAVHLAHNAERIAIVGAGQQGAAHVDSLYRCFPTASFTVWSPEANQVRDLIERAAAKGISVSMSVTVADAIRDAGIVVTATQATQPLFESRSLGTQTLVISIGSFEAHRCEVGAELLHASTTIAVDHAPTAQAHCGPLIELRRRGHAPHLAELGRVICGFEPKPEPGLTTYLSVGLGVQDAAAAWSIYRHARRLDVGAAVPW